MKRIVVLVLCTLSFGCDMSKTDEKYSRSQCIVLLEIEGNVDDRNALIDATGQAILDGAIGLAATAPKYKNNEIAGLYLQYKSSCEEKVNLTETLIREYLETEQLKNLSFNISKEIVNPGVDTIDVKGQYWLD
ncbi:hypothetical protein [Kangiella sp. M94]